MGLWSLACINAATRCITRKIPHRLIISEQIRCTCMSTNASVQRTCVIKWKEQKHAWKSFYTCRWISSTQRPVCSSLRLCVDTDVRIDRSCERRWFSKLSRLWSSENAMDDSKEPLKMRYVFVTCCEDIWEEVPKGLKFDVAYLDSHPEAPYTTRTPVVMGIHGAPGSPKDLIPVLQPMVDQGYRVIIPNLPGYKVTEGTSEGCDDCFTHSPEEYASFLAAFLTVIGIPRVDLLVGHSAGCHAILELCSEYKGVQSAMLINPVPHKPHRGIQPLWILQTVNNLWDKPMLRPLLKAFIYIGVSGRGFSKVSPSHMIISMRACVNLDYNDVIHNLVALKEMQLPVCVAFSDNDRLIHLSHFMEYYKLVGGTTENLETFTSDAPDSSQDITSYPRGVLLKGGGHYPLKEYPNILISELRKLLKHIGMDR